MPLDTNKRCPNFFIIGAAKAGTTTLYSALKKHPQVFMPQSDLKKEPAFLSHLAGGRSRRSEDLYLQLFEPANEGHIRIGEASTAYISDPYSPAMITALGKRYQKNIKLLVMLRNPVNRAYSLYNWNTSAGIEPASTFELALELEATRKKEQRGPKFNRNVYINQYMYFETGQYIDQLKRYYEWFPSNDIYVDIFEDFISNPVAHLTRICDFLGIDSSFDFPLDVHENQSCQVVSPQLQVYLRVLTRHLIARGLLRGYKSIRQRDFLLHLGLRQKKPSPMKLETRAMLRRRYQDSIEELQTLLGIPLDELWQ